MYSASCQTFCILETWAYLSIEEHCLTIVRYHWTLTLTFWMDFLFRSNPERAGWLLSVTPYHVFFYFYMWKPIFGYMPKLLAAFEREDEVQSGERWKVYPIPALFCIFEGKLKTHCFENGFQTFQPTFTKLLTKKKRNTNGGVHLLLDTAAQYTLK